MSGLLLVVLRLDGSVERLKVSDLGEEVRGVLVWERWEAWYRFAFVSLKEVWEGMIRRYMES